jgi:hypothetical protein
VFTVEKHFLTIVIKPRVFLKINAFIIFFEDSLTFKQSFVHIKTKLEVSVDSAVKSFLKKINDLRNKLVVEFAGKKILRDVDLIYAP